jgi:hypothetical protein
MRIGLATSMEIQETYREVLSTKQHATTDNHHEHHGTLEHAHDVKGFWWHIVVVFLARNQFDWIRKEYV